MSLLKSMIRHGKESSIGRRYRASSLPNQQELRGVILDFKNIDISPKVRLNISRGIYESEEADAIREHIDPHTDVIDLGGCLGFTAAYTNRMLGNNQTHVVVEPNKELIPMLKRTRELNKCDFEIVNAAYATDEEYVTLAIPEHVWGGSLHCNSSASLSVKAIDLRKIVNKNGVSNFMLIADIEGAEIDLIENELKLLNQKCSLIIIEFHDNKEEYSEISEEITAAKQSLENSEFDKVEEKSDVSVYKNTSL